MVNYNNELCQLLMKHDVYIMTLYYNSEGESTLH
jgi:hypothetical protein